MIHIESHLKLPVDPVLLENAARQTLAFTQAGTDIELTLVICDDGLLQRLNQQYMGIDAPTDVLSFPAEHTDPDSNSRYLGDVLISLPRAEQQASAGGYPLHEELQLLVVHGLLHLKGYDHIETGQTSQMQIAQDAIMKSLGSQNSPRLGFEPQNST